MRVNIPRFKSNNSDICVGKQRPGLLTPSIMPLGLSQQNNPTAPKLPLMESVVGKTLMKTPQWGVVVGKPGQWASGNSNGGQKRNHPGVARPNMVAKGDPNKGKVDNSPDAASATSN